MQCLGFLPETVCVFVQVYDPCAAELSHRSRGHLGEALMLKLGEEKGGANDMSN